MTRPNALVHAMLMLLLTISVASRTQAAFTSEICLAKKVKTWGKLRQCQHDEQAKAVLGKAADPAKCQTAFDKVVGRVDGVASKKRVACRYLDNGDDTITDTKTGLMWQAGASMVCGTRPWATM